MQVKNWRFRLTQMRGNKDNIKGGRGCPDTYRIGYGMDILVTDSENIDYIGRNVDKLQMIFHPEISPTGKIDYSLFWKEKAAKPYMLIIDRNIFSSLIKLCSEGTLTDRKELLQIAFLMVWSRINDVPISSGGAVMEYATSEKSQNIALEEIGKFRKIIDYYPTQMWFELALGLSESIPVCDFSNTEAFDITAQYAEGSDDFLMALVYTVQIVLLYRDNSLTGNEKLLKLFEWVYDNVFVSEDILTYAVLLFTNQSDIKAPKNANSNQYDKVIRGCKNQAWDLAYLMTCGRLHYHKDSYDEDFIFATGDYLLKRILINRYGPNGLMGLMYTVLNRRDFDRIVNYIEDKRKKRAVPEFDVAYYNRLLEEEKMELKSKIGI